MSPPALSPCRPMRAALDAIADGTVSAIRLAELERHAYACERCRGALVEAKQLRALLDLAPTVEPSKSVEDAFVSAVFARMEERAATPTPTTRPSIPRTLGWLVAAAAAAAGLIGIRALDGPVDSRVAAVALTQPAPSRVNGEPAPPTNPAIPTDESKETPLALRVLPDDVDPARLRLSWTAALALAPFDPAHSMNTSRWRRLVERDLGVAAAARAARQVLRGDFTSPSEAPTGLEVQLAARILGPRGDYQDRRLLMSLLPSVGRACALALAERGTSGIEDLWQLASAPEASDAGAYAEECLVSLATRGQELPLGELNLDRDRALGAQLITAGRDAATHLLSLYLDDGHDVWLATLSCRADANDALDVALTAALNRSRLQMSPRRGHSSKNAATVRLLAAIERVPCSLGPEFSIRALEAGEPRAAATLALTPGVEPLRLLIAATYADVLRPELEESAWAEFTDARYAEIADVIGDLTSGESTATLAALAVATEQSWGATKALLEIGCLPSPSGDARVFALLSAVNSLDGPRRRRAEDTLGKALRIVLQDEDARVAAAAAIALTQLGEPTRELPKAVASALRRSGTHHVRHLRVTRALEKARARESGRRDGRTKGSL